MILRGALVAAIIVILGVASYHEGKGARRHPQKPAKAVTYVMPLDGVKDQEQHFGGAMLGGAQ